MPRTSSATRLATDIAATRRGCVQPILPFAVYPASARYCVICGGRAGMQVKHRERKTVQVRRRPADHDITALAGT